jgi:hypothetical protein
MGIKGKRHMETKGTNWMILKFTLKKYGVKVGTSFNWLWRVTVNTVIKHSGSSETGTISSAWQPRAPVELLPDRPSIFWPEKYSKKCWLHTCIKKPVRYLNAQTQC